MEIITMTNINIDIICGSDVGRSVPINSVFMYTRIDDVAICFQNKTFFKFINITDFFRDIINMKAVQKCRPRLKPITAKLAQEFSRRMGYGASEDIQLDTLRKMIVKEYFRFFIWFGFSEKYKAIAEIEGVDFNQFIQYYYKKGSLFYQIYYGET